MKNDQPDFQYTQQPLGIVTHQSRSLTVTHWYGDVDAIWQAACRERDLEFAYAPTAPSGLR